MPLVKGQKARSRAGFSKNVENEMKFGKKPQKQAVAIAYSEADRAKRRERMSHKKREDRHGR